jgi:hypothetical protein
MCFVFLLLAGQHENHRRQQFGVLCILWFGKAVAFKSVKNEDLTPLFSF